MIIKLQTMGSHALLGWWVTNRMPKIPNHVEIIASEIWDVALDDNLNWLKSMGAVTVNINDDYTLLIAKRTNNMFRPKWLKDEYKFVIYLKNMDDECDIVQDYAITEDAAKAWCKCNIDAYGDVEEFQFYYTEIYN